MEDTICPISLLRLVKELLQKYTILSNFSLQIHVAKQAIKELGFIDHQWTMHVNDISSELNNVDFDVSLVISGQRWQNCPDTLAFDKSSNSIWNIFFNLNLNPIEPMNLLHFLAVISSPNERKMPDSLSPSQIHILLGDGEAEKKPIRTRWQLFLPQMREKWPMPCPHPRSKFYSGMERPRRNQLGMNSCLKNLLPASIWPSLLARRLSSTDDSILGQIFRMKVKMSPPRRFPMHDRRTITALTHKNIPSKIEQKRQSVKIENPSSSWTMALSRSIITQAINHQQPIKVW